MAKDSDEKLSDDTIACLEQAKKGKPRKFVLVNKGAAVVNLVVYKKGSVEKYKKEAKEAGSGQVSYGVVTGSGMELNFQLARSDGFERAPVKPMTLKEFLAERGDFKCKPLIEIVDAPLVVLDDEDPLAKRFLALQETALAACDKYPNRAAEIGGLCEQIGKLLDADDAKQGAAKLAELEKLLAGLSAPASTSEIPKAPPLPPQQTTAPQEKPAAPKNDALVAITARITALKPDLEKALAAKQPNAENLKLQVSQAGYHARKGEFKEAGALLNQVEKDLGKSPASVHPLAGSWETLRKEAEAKLATFAKSGPPATVEKLKKILALANTKAEAGDYKQAIQAVNQIEPLLVAPKNEGPAEPAQESPPSQESAQPTQESAPSQQSAQPSETAPQSDEQFAERAKQVRETWLDAKEIVDKQISALQKALRGTRDPVFARLAEYGLGGVTKRLQTGLLVSLMNLEKARGEARQKSQDQALKAIAEFQTLLKDPAIKHVDAKNPFGVQLSLQDTLGTALSEMQRSLSA